MNPKIINFLGIVFILIWASNIPYLFPHPFQPNNDVKNLSEEVANAPEFIKEEVRIGGRTKDDIEKILMRELQISWFKSLLLISVGILAGILIILKKASGRFLALGLSFYVIGMRAYNFFNSDHWRERLSFEYYKIQFQYFPVQTVHDKINFLALLGVIILLLMPSIAVSFRLDKTARSRP